MSIDLSSYKAIQTNIFIKIVVPGHATLAFSDYYRDINLGGTAYSALGQLLAVGNTADNLRAAPSDITFQISGIPSGRIAEILTYQFKGSTCEIYRGFFDAETQGLLSISGNPAGKFQGIISNYEINDELDMGSDTGTITITFTATSIVEILYNKVNGRKTNPAYFADGDMDNVIPLSKANINFGAPK